MKAIPTIVMLAALGGVLLLGGCRPADTETAAVPADEPTGFAAAGDTLFFEDFSADSLDRSHWNVRITDETFGIVNNEQQAYIDSSSVVYLVQGEEAQGAANGALVLQAHYRPGHVTARQNTFDFTSGRIDTQGKMGFTYGTVAARIKLPAGSGLWPAFWVLGSGPWPDTGEIDIMEYVGETDWTSVALHGPGYSGETPLVNKVYLPEDNDATEWHVYSVDWTPEGFLFKLDGELIYRATRPMVEHYGEWAFSNPKYLILNLALGGAYPVKTNGVTEPYNGMPQAAVDLVKAGGARMLVDWVLVTQE